MSLSDRSDANLDDTVLLDTTVSGESDASTVCPDGGEPCDPFGSKVSVIVCAVLVYGDLGDC